MLVKSIFVNLPVRDLTSTRAFWSKLGFSFNEQFSDEKAACLVLSDGSIYAMLITHEYFETFTNRPIADGTSTQVLLAIEVDSRDAVDDVIAKALNNGGQRYRDGSDMGWMYYDCFADPDGHQWEVLYTDMAQLEQQKEQA